MRMRLFAAVELDDDVRRTIARLAGKLRSAPGAKWVREENLHMTLRFFGEWPAERLHEMKGALGAIQRPAAEKAPLVGVRFFPNPQSPRVVIVLARVSKAFYAFQREIEQAARRLGLEPDGKPFTPHVTLGRVRDPRQGRKVVEAAKEIKPPSAGLEINSFALVESKLSPRGSTYTRLEEFPFD